MNSIGEVIGRKFKAAWLVALAFLAVGLFIFLHQLFTPSRHVTKMEVEAYSQILHAIITNEQQTRGWGFAGVSVNQRGERIEIRLKTDQPDKRDLAIRLARSISDLRVHYGHTDPTLVLVFVADKKLLEIDYSSKKGVVAQREF